MGKRNENINHPGERRYQNDEAGDNFGNKHQRHFLDLRNCLKQTNDNSNRQSHEEHRGGDHQGDSDGFCHNSNDKIHTHNRVPPSSNEYL
jgi:hypothetical protein